MHIILLRKIKFLNYFDTIAKCRVEFIKNNIFDTNKILNVLEVGPGKCHLHDNFKEKFDCKKL